MLGLLPVSRPLSSMSTYVMNVNVPGSLPIKGYCWAKQGRSCACSSFDEVVDRQGHTKGGQQLRSTSTSMDYQQVLSLPGTREFVRGVANVGGLVDGTDLAVVKEGYISITPLGLLTHLEHLVQADLDAAATMAEVVVAAGKDAGLTVTGLPQQPLHMP